MSKTDKEKKDEANAKAVAKAGDAVEDALEVEEKALDKQAKALAPAKKTKQPDPVGPYLLEGEGGYKPSAPGRGQVSVYDKRNGTVAAILPSLAEARAWADKQNKNEADAKGEKALRLP